ncbi:MAG: hypothetical protein BA863_10375 [Desulfovibrio sp. S3730MH75]|nr:MAG: hypothetical protein BA863_10375 [Desulfovibrio sp. S3730MH75]
MNRYDLDLAAKPEPKIVKCKDGDYVRYEDAIELGMEIDVLRRRLEFDPGGSDKIDELEDALAQVRCRAETAESKLKAGVTYLKLSNAVFLPNEQIDKIFDCVILNRKEGE